MLISLEELAPYGARDAGSDQFAVERGHGLNFAGRRSQQDLIGGPQLGFTHVRRTPFHAAAGVVGPFRSLNNYGLFAVMTNPRPELIFEGSDDGRTWHAYEFPHKPGDLSRRPTWVAPHQPRLDWQLWFAALGAPQHNPWVLAICEQLLRGNPTVLELFSRNPFSTQPPRFIRVVRFEYHFTDASTRARTGQWWRRTPIDYYVQPSSLK